MFPWKTFAKRREQTPVQPLLGLLVVLRLPRLRDVPRDRHQVRGQALGLKAPDDGRQPKKHAIRIPLPPVAEVKIGKVQNPNGLIRSSRRHGGSLSVPQVQGEETTSFNIIQGPGHLPEEDSRVGGWRHPRLKREKGSIYLFAYASRGKTEFRNIEIRDLSPLSATTSARFPVYSAFLKEGRMSLGEDESGATVP